MTSNWIPSIRLFLSGITTHIYPKDNNYLSLLKHLTSIKWKHLERQLHSYWDNKTDGKTIWTKQYCCLEEIFLAKQILSVTPKLYFTSTKHHNGSVYPTTHQQSDKYFTHNFISYNSRCVNQACLTYKTNTDTVRFYSEITNTHPIFLMSVL